MIAEQPAQPSYLSRAPYFPVGTKFAVSVFADMVDVTAIKPTLTEFPKFKDSGTKQTIKGFSNKSRHAMIEFLAKVVEVPDLFVTLTYSDDVVNKASTTMHRDFEAFRKRLERAYAGIRAMWRIEFVERKSGEFIGVFQPHFHLLVWLPDNLTAYQREMILEKNGQKWREGWHDIVRSNNPAHLSKYGCDVQPIKSRKHAYAYCSKYLAKENYENIEAGRRWGRIGEFEQPTEAETELTQRQYVHFKRLLYAYIKAEALKRFKHQKIVIPFRPLPLSHFMQFADWFKRMNINSGCSVFGLGFISQEKPIGNRTIYRMLRHARELAKQEGQ